MLNLGRTVEGPNFIVQIAGIWQARDVAESFWFYGRASFDELFLVPEDTFANVIAPVLGDEVNFCPLVSGDGWQQGRDRAGR